MANEQHMLLLNRVGDHTSCNLKVSVHFENLHAGANELMRRNYVYEVALLNGVSNFRKCSIDIVSSRTYLVRTVFIS